MNSSIIVSGLSKSYPLRHETTEKYTALRDVISSAPKRLMKKKKHVTVEEFWALKDVSFNVEPGERLGIIGRNGAGKSTLLKLLSRITVPTAGSIRIKGRVASLLEVGTGFHPELSGRENIFLNGAILGMTRAEIKKHFDAIVDFAEIEKFLDTPVKRYSSGMYVRLAFAVAAHLEPEILVVDEVLAVGDAQFQKKCLGKMEDVSRNEGRTVLFVSHQMGIISQLCKRTLLLDKGNLVMDGETRHVIDHYMLKNQGGENEYTGVGVEKKEAAFISIKTVNASGVTTDEYLFDESICLEVKILVNNLSPGLKLSVTIQNTNGDFLSTIAEDVSSLTKGTGEFGCTIKFRPSLIAPNSYAFRLALFHYNITTFDIVEMVCPVRIIDNGTPMALFEGINYGCFLIDYDIKTWKEHEREI